MATMARPKQGRPAAAAVGAPIEAPMIKEQVKTGRTVMVMCKLPNGLILRLQKKETYIEQTMTGPREFERWVDRSDTKRYIVAGPAYPVMPPKGYPRQVPIEGGYAMTRGIPSDFWEEWVKQNALAPYVIDGAIFAMSDISDVTVKARDQEDYKTGLEPLEVGRDKITDYRLPKPHSPHIYYTHEDAAAERNS